MCLKSIKRLLGKEKIEPQSNTVENSSPRTDEHTPSPDYLEGKMPTYEIVDLVAHLRYRILIHENWIGYIDLDPIYATTHGDENFHLWAIEGYLNSIYYLERFNGEMPNYDRLSLYSRRMDT